MQEISETEVHVAADTEILVFRMQQLALVTLLCYPLLIFSQNEYIFGNREHSNVYDLNIGEHPDTLQLGNAGGLSQSLQNFFNPRQFALGFGLGLAKAMVLAAISAGFSKGQSRSHVNYIPEKNYGYQKSAYSSKSTISHPGNMGMYRGDTDSYEEINPNRIYSKYHGQAIGNVGDYKSTSEYSYGALPHQESSSALHRVESPIDSYSWLTKGDANLDKSRKTNGKYGNLSTSTLSYGGLNRAVNDYKDMYQLLPSYSYNNIARNGRSQANDYDNYSGYSGNVKSGGERNNRLDMFSLHRGFVKAKTTLLRGLLSPLASLKILGENSGNQDSYRQSPLNYDTHRASPKSSFSLSPSLGLGAYLGAKAGLIKGVIMSRVLSDSGILKTDHGYTK